MKKINIFWAFSPIILLISLLSLNVILFSDDATGGANQIALIISAMFGVLVAMDFRVERCCLLDEPPPNNIQIFRYNKLED